MWDVPLAVIPGPWPALPPVAPWPAGVAAVVLGLVFASLVAAGMPGHARPARGRVVRVHGARAA
jgi:hypothetical protein